MKQHIRNKLDLLRTIILFLNDIVCAIIAPPVCVACRRFIDGPAVVCTPCRHSIQPIVSHSLVITKQYAVLVFAVSAYEGTVQHLIRAKQGRKIFAARSLGYLIWDLTDIQFQEFDYIVPVPLHWRRYAFRGYNQAEEMVHALSKRSGKPVLTCLQRLRHTAVQASLSAQERVTNVQDSFRVKNRYHRIVNGARILLVDDVLTTGSTVEACVRTLRRERPLSIIVAVGARVV